MFTEFLSDHVACEEGVIDTLNWCLYEVMDNVFQHSQAASGFVMMQLHVRARRCVIGVADTGIGIQKSLFTSGHFDLPTIADAGSAINKALQQGVTSKIRINQGNGLFGLRRAVEVNGGSLSVRSGRGSWQLDEGGISWNADPTTPIPDAINHQATLVDWRLDCAKKVRIEEALGGGHSPVNDFIENIEDEEGAHRVSVSEIEAALGSRKLGTEIRTRLENYLRAGARHVVLDFRGVGVISSSFADEVMAKLAEQMGELEFRRRIFVDGASMTNRRLIDRAIALRLQAEANGSFEPQ
ncbi:STAS-like domain-containing protein [Isoptericola sp. NPDC056573]|uniref:STAS-like domain-containing protein n=1 Tax=Isoptericola sp. NPDC056573 TaxID=3345868 RepID=UPI003691601F